MPIRFYKTVLGFVLILATLACSLFTSVPEPSTEDIDREEQAVYAVFIRDNKGPAVILQNTSTGDLQEDPKQLLANLKESLQGISKETINSYAKRNAQQTQLSPDMQLGVEYVLLSSEELAEISSQGNWNEILQERYPGSNGYYIFSRVGFNKALDQAVVYMGNVAGPLMGAGYYYLLEKQNDAWEIKEEIMVWIS